MAVSNIKIVISPPSSVGGQDSRLTVHALRLTPGEELYTALMRYAADRKLRAPFVMSCCGSVTKATLRLAAYSASSPNNVRRDLH